MSNSNHSGTLQNVAADSQEKSGGQTEPKGQDSRLGSRKILKRPSSVLDDQSENRDSTNAKSMDLEVDGRDQSGAAIERDKGNVRQSSEYPNRQ